MTRMIIVGAGYLGERCASAAAARGDDVIALRRRPWASILASTNEATSGPRVTRLSGSMSRPECWWPSSGAEALVVTVPPTTPDYIEGLETLVRFAAERETRTLILSSSTGVYAERDGGWVEESSPLDLETHRGRKLVNAERTVANCGIARTTILRFSGIYGPDRWPWGRALAIPAAPGESLAEQALRNSRNSNAPGDRDAWTNRVHVDDAVAAVLFVLDQGLSGTFNVSDDRPATYGEIAAWLRARMEPEPGNVIATESPAPDANREAPTSRRPRGNKRVSSRRLRDFGWTPRIADYRTAWNLHNGKS